MNILKIKTGRESFSEICSHLFLKQILEIAKIYKIVKVQLLSLYFPRTISIL